MTFAFHVITHEKLIFIFSMLYVLSLIMKYMKL